jgi:hypothetical protein
MAAFADCALSNDDCTIVLFPGPSERHAVLRAGYTVGGTVTIAGTLTHLRWGCDRREL